MLEVLDVIFHFAHISLIIINVTFWMSFRTLRLAQVTQFLTLLSWVGFGFFYGFGYCFLTDWQWQVKEKLGERNLPDSYIKYMLDRITGKDWSPVLVSKVAIFVLLISVAGCLVQTVREKKKRS